MNCKREFKWILLNNLVCFFFILSITQITKLNWHFPFQIQKTTHKKKNQKTKKEKTQNNFFHEKKSWFFFPFFFPFLSREEKRKKERYTCFNEKHISWTFDRLLYNFECRKRNPKLRNRLRRTIRMAGERVKERRRVEKWSESYREV